MMTGEIPKFPKISFGLVDVRNVAEAHVKALQTDEAQGKRFILYDKSMWMVEMAQTLAAEFNLNGYSIGTTEAPYCVMKLIALWDRQAALMVKNWGNRSDLVNKRSKEVLGIEYRPTEKGLTEFGYSLIEQGIVPDNRKQK